jgi:hypothetical protein
MKIGIVGSRTWTNAKLMARTIESYVSVHGLKWKDIILISGGAKGADKLAEEFAEGKNIAIEVYLPDYKIYNKNKWEAPHKRNTTIAHESEFLFCFWDGKSRGCMDTVEKIKKYGKQFVIITDSRETQFCGE